jgi:ABC-type multidrug transport system ATPase subunit
MVPVRSSVSYCRMYTERESGCADTILVETGKTTTVSVLTGLFPATSGDCVIYGNSVVHDIQEARQSIGICPQHNVLFDSLTVAEHLRFFMKIKGLKPTAAAVQHHADEIGLTDFMCTTSASLSGGNKRKLSVAIALCADPKCLILDEPTSAMDPHSRRAVWELLRAKRKGRVTLLTTHFLDEAEILCDRIAVMKSGKLQCSGSPNFLKERFGLGYNLTVVLESLTGNQDGASVKEPDEPFVFASQLSLLSALVQKLIPGTVVIRVSGKEVTYRIPRGFERLLPDLFDALEAEGQVRGVGAFGVRDSSLEEIFLQLAEDSADEDDDLGANSNPKFQALVSHHSKPRDPEDEDPLGFGKDCEAITGEGNDFMSPCDTSKDSGSVENADLVGDEMPCCDAKQAIKNPAELQNLSPIRQIGLLYWKRFVVQRRDVKGFCFALIVPLVVIALVLVVLLIEPKYVGSAIEVSPALYSEVVGERSNTGVTIGSDSVSTIEFERISSNLVKQYPFVEVFGLQNATSQEISDYLLETYNERISPPRFGAFALEDVIDVSIRVDWNDLSQSLESMIGSDISPLIQTLAQGGVNTTSTMASTELIESSINATGLITDDKTDLNVLETDLNVLDFIASILARFNLTLGELLNTVLSQVNNTSIDLQDVLPGLSSRARDASQLQYTGFGDRLQEGNVTYERHIPIRASILHNSSSPHAVAAFNQAFASYLFQSSCNSSSTARLASVNEPLPMTQQQSIEVQTVLSILAAIFLLIPFGYIPGAFIVFLVKERISKSKHLQLVSGVNMTSYWLSHYIWDLTLFAVLTFCVMMVRFCQIQLSFPVD